MHTSDDDALTVYHGAVMTVAQVKAIRAEHSPRLEARLIARLFDDAHAEGGLSVTEDGGVRVELREAKERADEYEDNRRRWREAGF
jgi:hypothetical protein